MLALLLTLILNIFFLTFLAGAHPALAQLQDATKARNLENAGIHKTLSEQIGAGRGNIMTSDSSIFIIRRDPFRGIRRGRQIFQRKFGLGDGLGPLTNDGFGDIESDPSLGAGLADSCAACHGRPRGSAGFGGTVFTRPDSRDAPHLFGVGLQEMLADEITQDLRQIRHLARFLARVSQTPITLDLSSKGIGFGRITARPDGSLDTSEVEGISDDLRVRPFFTHGGEFSLRGFIVGAFHDEMGLESADPLLQTAADGGRTVTPAGMVLDGRLDEISAPPVASPLEDGDSDGVVNEIHPALADHLEFYLLNYFAPATYRQTPETEAGRQYMEHFACTTCHIPDLPIDHDRRVGSVKTAYDPDQGIFNQLFAEVEGRFVALDDGSGFPTLKRPQGGPFLVENIFTDFKRHDLGPGFWERNFDGTLTKEIVTEPLWGVGTTGPYGHDGRSINLHEVILRHGGAARAARDAFAAAPEQEQEALIGFLRSLVLFPPDDTASNLDPGDPLRPGFPQHGHGSISLSVLFNDPGDPE